MNYTATGANALENWYLMNRAASKKLSVNIDIRLWTFHKMFMNHIKNMVWITFLVFTELCTGYNIAKGFEKFRIETIWIDYHALKITTQPTDSKKNSNPWPLHLAFQLK